ncbi:hypothetical protein [Sphingobacterium sp. LRF_L2]|uniref:hypothetical protein n=1 Tax=Sphingobacterium sp. LRF_L2 TaxID=3369421 RepID=UPI003F641F97
MNSVVKFSLLMTIILLLGCDPVRVFQVKALKEESELYVYLKKSKDISLFGIQTHTLRVSLAENPEYKIHFGIGSWTEAEIYQVLTSSIDSIIIYQNLEKKMYKSPKDIHNYLKSQRRIFHKNVILIEK